MSRILTDLKKQKAKERARKWYYDNLEKAKQYRKLDYQNKKEVYKARRKKWWQENQEKNKQNCKAYYQKHKLELNKKNREWAKNNRKKIITQKIGYHNRTYQAKRSEVLMYYGNGKIACVCCGECEKRFMTIDHINNDGKEHRKKVRPGNLYAWLIRNKFPNGFQTLCFNCNSGRSLNKGICPHKQIENKVLKGIHIEWHGEA